MDVNDKVAVLESLLRAKEQKIKELEDKLCVFRQKCKCGLENSAGDHCMSDETLPGSNTKQAMKLSKDEVSRYGRQLILPEFGVKGQLALRSTAVLIVGAGGLGCPCAIYLAAAGVGCLGILDYDEVEISNLHRQILHQESSVGVAKDESAVHACKRLNSRVHCVPHHMAVNKDNIMSVLPKYDIVVDASDNVATRYLLNDTCVLAKKPLVSGSALRFEGQLTVYNYKGGPCYRCLFPSPPPPHTVTNCSEGGVIGAVPGVIGTLQALECIKMAAKAGDTLSQKLLLFDGLDGSFRTIKLRPRQSNCCVCGTNPSITELIDYEEFCGASATDKCLKLALLDSKQRITAKDYKRILDEGSPHVLVDVRPPHELEICKLPIPCINIPITTIDKPTMFQPLKETLLSNGMNKVIVACRRGNDSQVAVLKLKEHLQDIQDLSVTDLAGGLTAWANQIDPNFPIY